MTDDSGVHLSGQQWRQRIAFFPCVDVDVFLFVGRVACQCWRFAIRFLVQHELPNALEQNNNNHNNNNNNNYESNRFLTSFPKSEQCRSGGFRNNDQ